MPDLTFQPLLFTCSSSSKTYDCMNYYKAAYNLLTDKEKKSLSHRCRKGRTGYLLSEIFAIMIVKQVYRLQTVKETLHLLEDNQNLCTFLGIDKIPSEATVSRLSGRVESLVNIHCLMERLIGQYVSVMDRTIGHLSIDSTIVEAREKPIKTNKTRPIGKKGRKKIGSEEQRQYLLKKTEESIYLTEDPDISLSKLEKRCSLTGKKKQ